MTRSPHKLLLCVTCNVICSVVLLNTEAFGQVRKYTDAFDKAGQSEPTIVNALKSLTTAHSKLDRKELLVKLNEWGRLGATSAAVPRAAFKLKEDVIVMKVFWDEQVESKSKEWVETEAMNHCFRVANDTVGEWNKDRGTRLVRFAGIELLALPFEQRETKKQGDGSQEVEVVASPEVLILIE